MTNQSSCRSGHSAAGRPMTGAGRSMSDHGRFMAGYSMSGYSDPRRPMTGSVRSGQTAVCPRTESRTQSVDTACDRKHENEHPCQDKKSVTCIATANFPVGMAYVPMQKWGPLYDHQKALSQGTLFPELDKPFAGGRAAR